MTTMGNAIPGLIMAALVAMALYNCDGGDPGHRSTYDCSRHGKPTYHTQRGQRCYPDD